MCAHIIISFCLTEKSGAAESRAGKSRGRLFLARLKAEGER